MAFYRRRLPHWQPGRAFVFITWRLFGSLPTAKLRIDPCAAPGEQFRAIDRQLDRALLGPKWLAEPAIAKLVADALHLGEQRLHLCNLLAWVVMPNHVHVLIYPYAELRRITHSIKNFTAVKANRMLGRSGKRFWQEESFDHWVRDRVELKRIASYIENNPVRAKLVSRPESWLWSSAGWTRQ